MNAKTAEQHMQCHCGPGRENDDSRIRKALKFVAKNGELNARLERQLELDARALEWIGRIGLPADVEEKFHSMEAPAGPHFSLKRALRQPPVLAVIVALLVMLGWFVYDAVIRAGNFPGRDAVEQMLDATDEMSGTELAPKATEAGLLSDWLFSQYGFENYYLPGELGRLKTAGCRVFKQNGFPVAQIAIEEHQSFLFVFDADDFGVKISPPDRWRVFQMDDWSVGILAHEDVCVVIALHGTKGEMRHFLADRKL
jgi:hypothetical protein